MLERGDYVVPYLNNRYRFDKPPLTYWAQSLSYRVLGENDFAARLPSAIAAALTALILFAWGRRLGDARVAWWSALFFSLCLQTFVHAKAAVADMWLVLFMTLAHWAGYELLRDFLKAERPTSNVQRPTPNEGDAPVAARWWWIFYLSLALGFLAKGPIAWMPLLTLGVVKWMVPGLQIRRRFSFFAGALLTFTLVALWGIPALIQTEGLFFDIGIGKHVVERSVGVMEGHGAKTIWSYLATLPFYFGFIFLSFAPWSLKLPWLTRKLWRERDPVDCYLIAGVAVVFIIFTFVKTKLPHYTLPALPLLALLLARALRDAPGAPLFVRRVALITLALAFVAVCLSPLTARISPARDLARQARADLRPEMEIGAVAHREPSVIWYFRAHIDGWMVDLDEPGLPGFFAKPGPRAAIMPRAIAERVYPVLPDGWKRYTSHGFNLAKGKSADLTLLLKPEDAP